MESFVAVLPNVVALVLTAVILIWQSANTTGYERRQKEQCEDELKDLTERYNELRIEKERLELLMMGRGITITGGKVDIHRDMVGGDVDDK